MKKRVHWTKRCALAILSGGMLLSTANCLPDNFYVDLWGAVLSDTLTGAATSVTDNVIDQLFATTS